MVRGPGENRLSAVNLLEGDKQSQFVLESLRPERPKQICSRAGGIVPTIGSPNQQGETGKRTVAEILNLRGKRATGEGFSTFIKQDTVAPLGKLQHPLMKPRSDFHKVTLDLGENL